MRSKFALPLLVALGAAPPALAQPQGGGPRVERPARAPRPAPAARQARPARPPQARPMRSPQARPAPRQRAPTMQQQAPRRMQQQARPAPRPRAPTATQAPVRRADAPTLRQASPTRRPTATQAPIRRDRVAQQPVQRPGRVGQQPVQRPGRVAQQPVQRAGDRRPVVRNVDRSVTNIDRSRTVDRSVTNIDRSRTVVARDVNHYHRGGRPVYRNGTWWYGGYGYRSYPYWYVGGSWGYPGYGYGYGGYPGYGYGYGGYGYGGGWASWLAPLLGSLPMALSIAFNNYPPYGYCQVYVPSGGYLIGSPMSCSYAFQAVPQGGWVLYRTQSNPGVVHGFVFDPASPGQPIGDLVFDANTGQLLQQLPV